MAEFVRARSDANKEKRFIELKTATELLFHEKTYHEIRNCRLSSVCV